MKIGILSINAHTRVLNFASPLHTFAFWQFLKNHGIESTIIDYKPVYFEDYDVKHPLFYHIDHPQKVMSEWKPVLKKWKNLFYEREIRYERFEEFIRKYYHKTDRCYTAELLETEDPGFDCYICVTDVIWQDNVGFGFDRGFFLACKQLAGKKKIAYAASRGPRKYTAERAKEFFDYISDIDYLSVREKSLQDFIRQNSNLPVALVLDPVFFHEKSFYYEMAKPPKQKGYVLIYIVMERSRALVKTAVGFAAHHNLEVIELSEDLKDADIPKGTHHEVVYGIGVEEWLGYMQNAAYIFTNSFHACCFSIIFGRQFFAGARRGDKIDSILALFGLSGRRVFKNSPDVAIQMPDIDFSDVDALRHRYVQESSDFILNAIHALENGEHKNCRDLVNKEIYLAEDPVQKKASVPQKGYLKSLKQKLKGFIRIQAN